MYLCIHVHKLDQSMRHDLQKIGMTWTSHLPDFDIAPLALSSSEGRLSVLLQLPQSRPAAAPEQKQRPATITSVSLELILIMQVKGSDM